MKLKRNYARLCILVFALGLGCWLFPGLVTAFTGKAFPRSAVLLGVGTVFVLGALGIKYLLLKCPNCGYSGLSPQWRKNDSYHCPGCGKKVHWE